MGDVITVQTHHTPLGRSRLEVANNVVSLYKDFGWDVDVKVKDTHIDVISTKYSGHKKVDRIF